MSDPAADLSTLTADACNERGLAAARARRFDLALPWFEAAVQRAPQDAKLRANLGVALKALGRLGEALAQQREAARLDPGFFPGRNNLANALIDAGFPAEAAEHYRAALALNPDAPELRRNYALALNMLGAHAAAETLLQDALRRQPQSRDAWRSLLTHALYDPQRGPTDRLALHRRCNAAFPAEPKPVWPNSPLGSPPRRLRLGVLSSDLREHALGRSWIPLLIALADQGFEIWVYSLAPQEDAASDPLRAHCAGWRRVVALNDAQIAATMRDDRVDLALILGGHFDQNRPFVAQHRPAPLVIGAGDGPFGLDGFDYYLSDRRLSPRPSRFDPLAAGWERALRPPALYAQTPPLDPPPPDPPPAAWAFLAPHSPRKLNASTLAAWGEILRRAPTATLTLRHRASFTEPGQQQRIIAACGADVAERLGFAGPLPTQGGHLRDLAGHRVVLDPFPFTGATAVFESLWAGVPVISLSGDDYFSRYAEAMLAQVGLSDCVAPTLDAYIARAVRLVQDTARLTALRPALRARLAAAPLSDPPRVARWIGRSLRAAWRRFDAGRAGEAR